jgi:SAM-dependent methyltransferase
MAEQSRWDTINRCPRRPPPAATPRPTALHPRTCPRTDREVETMEPQESITREPCPVCACLSVRRLLSLPTSRGMRQWTRCPSCHSYSDCQRFELDSEVSHTRTRPWGNIEHGLELKAHRRVFYRSVLRLLNRYAASGSSLVDVGCSYGGFLEEARRQGYLASGMDIVPEAADYCRGQGFSCQVAASLGEVDIANASVDAISVLDCNCYWPNQIRELRAIRDKLSSNGLLVMRVVNKSWMVTTGLALRSLSASWSNTICARAINDHRASIPVRSLLRVLRQERFTILYASPAGSINHDNSSLAVKAAYVLGYMVWRVSGRNFAPGCLILARKQPT